MVQKVETIPVNPFANVIGSGILIGKVSNGDLFASDLMTQDNLNVSKKAQNFLVKQLGVVMMHLNYLNKLGTVKPLNSLRSLRSSY